MHSGSWTWGQQLDKIQTEHQFKKKEGLENTECDQVVCVRQAGLIISNISGISRHGIPWGSLEWYKKERASWLAGVWIKMSCWCQRLEENGFMACVRWQKGNSSYRCNSYQIWKGNWSNNLYRLTKIRVT